MLRPAAKLAPFVERFNAYSERDLPSARRRELPDGRATMLFNLGDELRFDRLAAEIGCSRKHLTVRFSREFGMAPKAMGRVLRFARALRRLRQDRAVGRDALAAECGYADQSHLGRDFREMSGASPGALAARALPDDAGFADQVSGPGLR